MCSGFAALLFHVPEGYLTSATATCGRVEI